jgi:hypothetical protein
MKISSLEYSGVFPDYVNVVDASCDIRDAADQDSSR